VPASDDHPRDRRILLVEVHAHKGFGHYPVVFAELGTALVALGYDVEALTQCGWYFEGDPAFATIPVRRFGRTTNGAWSLATALARVPPRGLAGRLSLYARTRVLMSATSRLVRDEGFTDVIVTSGIDTMIGARMAKRGRWLAYRFNPPSPSERKRAGRRLRRTRSGEARAPRLRIAVSTSTMAESWAEVAPWLAPVMVPFIAARPRDPIPDARQRLGLPDDKPVALLFGANPTKDCEVVWRAFDRMPEWCLVIGGFSGVRPSAGAYRDWAARQEAIATTPVLFDGYATEETRSLVYAAADIVINSVKAGSQSDSGNLVDAISWGRAVVQSDHCPAADIVRRHGLGAIFEPSDIDSLVAVVQHAPRQPDPDGLRDALAELGAAAVAQRNLDALDALDGYSPGLANTKHCASTG